MISYALSTSAFGGVSTPECINALRQSKFRKFEMCFGVKAFSEEVQQICRNVRQLVKEGVMDIASIHMPFHNEPNGMPLIRMRISAKRSSPIM